MQLCTPVILGQWELRQKDDIQAQPGQLSDLVFKLKIKKVGGYSSVQRPLAHSPVERENVLTEECYWTYRGGK